LISEDGMFIPTPDAIRLFDYYLTTLGETDVDGVRTLVAGDARRYAPERVDDVLELFDRYIAYRDDLADALAVRPDIPIADLLAVTLSRQRAHFGDDADILFGEDNALADQLLARASGNGVRSSSSMKSRSLP
jgi:lipase chaperone LimK